SPSRGRRSTVALCARRPPVHVGGQPPGHELVRGLHVRRDRLALPRDPPLGGRGLETFRPCAPNKPYPAKSAGYAGAGLRATRSTNGVGSGGRPLPPKGGPTATGRTGRGRVA